MKESTVTRFNGGGNVLRAKRFLDEMSLEGKARTWFLAKEELFKDFKEFKKILGENEEEAPKEFIFYMKVLEGPKEGIIEFIYELKILSLGVNGALKTAKQCIKKSFPEFMHEKLEDVATWAKLVEFVEGNERPQKNRFFSGYKKCLQEEAISKASINKKEKKILCFKCGGPHYANECKEKKEVNIVKSTKFIPKIEKQFESGKTILIPIKFNGKKMKALLDTGANENYISGAFGKRMRI